ncbi:MAG: Ig-like domain-containing protein [Dehalococcoidales bacterium]|nr:Ig-like domain-containing protein [Dehalococcoidales bacterium]
MRYLSALLRLSCICAVAAILAIVTATGVVMAESPADLAVHAITLSPPFPPINSNVTVTVTVKNQGGATAPSCQVACYLDESLLGTAGIAALSPGATAGATFTFRAQAGTHTIRAVVDPGNAVPEADETNNSKSFIFTTLAPDLVVQAISPAPGSPSRGESVTISVTVKNQGTSRASASAVHLYIDGNSRGLRDITPLEPGATSTVTYIWTAQAGTHTIRAVADETDLINEGDETNNETILYLTALAPDLIVSSITWSPQNPSKDDNVTFTATIKNQGQGRSDACQVGYAVGDDYRSVLTVDALDPGKSSNITFNWTMRSETDVPISVVVDPLNIVVEGDETNNSLTVSLSPSLPDLVVSNITWNPGNPSAGDKITFTATVRNQGTGRATASRLSFAIGNEPASYADIAAIEASKTASATFSWVVPDESTYGIWVLADIDNRVRESNERNNSLSQTISVILPDISISYVSYAPQNPQAGETVTFTANITNTGNGRAMGFYVGYYLDDKLLGTDFVTGIAPGSSSATTYTWKAEGGRHTFRISADHDGKVRESNEDNNDRSVPITVSTPDIAVGAITWTPAEIKPADRMTLAIKIENRGAQAAGAFRIAYYVDGEVSGYSDIGYLNAMSATTLQFIWEVASGHHTITVTADAGNQIAEIDETNNSRTLHIPFADLAVTEITGMPREASSGQDVTFTATIRNVASGPSPASQVTFCVDGEPAFTTDLTPLPGNSSTTLTFSWKAIYGTHEVAVSVDSNDVIIEPDETNNEKSLTFTTRTPDLTIEDIAWSMKDPLSSSATTITITVSNRGDGTARNVGLEWSINRASPESVEIPELLPGESYTLSRETMLKGDSHTITATVDPANGLVELDETNNEKTITFSTLVPDIAIKVLLSPSQAGAAEEVPIVVSVENRGRVKSPATTLVLYIDGEPIVTKEIPTLGIGAVASSDLTWQATAGEHEITVRADPEGLIEESNKDNNARSATISVSTSPPETRPREVKKAATPPTTPRRGTAGFLGKYWWSIAVIALVLGGTTVFMVLRSLKKK